MAVSTIFQSVTLKVLGIGFLALLMLIPLTQVQDLIREREGLRRAAIAQIAQRWGSAQMIGGPLLVIPKSYKIETSTGWHTTDVSDVVLPDRLEISGQLVVEQRHYGIYSTPVYTGDLKVHAHFLRADLKALKRDDLDVELKRSELRLPVTDVRGLRRVAKVSMNGLEVPTAPTSGEVAGMSAIVVPMDAKQIGAEGFDIDMELTLAGTESLQFLPLARHSDVSLTAPWKDPSFVGAFLPAERHFNAEQFDAHWQVLDLNRRLGQHWEEDKVSHTDLANAAFGVELYQPVGLYQQNTRAGKYGVLFIGLSFLTFFLFEVLRRLRVHPVQYVLVGLALCTFYAVLLALSEQIGFTCAYLVAAICVVLMVASYGSVMLGGRRHGVMLGGLLAMVYGLLYGLVVSEQYSLLMGSIALLATIALMMYLTRRVDWYGLSSREELVATPRQA